MSVKVEFDPNYRPLTVSTVRHLFPPLTTAILVTQLVLFVVGSLGEDLWGMLAGLLALVPERVRGGWVWQLWTYSLLDRNSLTVLLNGLALMFFASRLERTWGRGRFAGFVALVVFLTGLPYLVASDDVLFTTFVLPVASVAAVGWVYRRQQAALFSYRIPIPTYCVALLLILALLSLPPLTNLVIFLAALWGYLYARWMERRMFTRAGQVRPGGRPAAPARARESKGGGRFSGLDLD